MKEKLFFFVWSNIIKISKLNVHNSYYYYFTVVKIIVILSTFFLPDLKLGFARTDARYAFHREQTIEGNKLQIELYC